MRSRSISREKVALGRGIESRNSEGADAYGALKATSCASTMLLANAATLIPKQTLSIPVAFAFKVAAWDLKQAIGAVVGDNLLIDASRAPDLVTVFAVHQMLQRIKTEVGARGARVECPLIVLWAPRR